MNEMNTIIDDYCNKYKYILDYFYLYCDENINNDIEIEKNTIKLKMKEDNWCSLLIKVVKGLDHFKNHNYKNVVISNVNTFINIPILLNYINKDINCLSVIYEYNFKNIKYPCPSGALYIFNNNTVRLITDIFNKNKYITQNKLSNFFCENYPTTDDIFFGYFFYLNKIPITKLNRIDLLNKNILINNSYKQISHLRIKTCNYEKDLDYFNQLNKLIYN